MTIQFTDLVPGEVYRGTHTDLSKGEYWLFQYVPYNDGVVAFHFGPCIFKSSGNFSWKDKIMQNNTLSTPKKWTFSTCSPEEYALLGIINDYSIY